MDQTSQERLNKIVEYIKTLSGPTMMDMDYPSNLRSREKQILSHINNLATGKC